MSDPTLWPALRGAELPLELRYERAVWGKVHGARSDFRWIALSKGFERSKGLEREFYLGSQDAPRRLIFCRSVGTLGYFTGVAYPSRAMDASGRTGVLEKQIFKWSGAPNPPAALVALLLLPHIWPCKNDIWWNRREEKDWTISESVLRINANDCTSSAPEDFEGYFNGILEKGLEQLKAMESSSPGELERFYTQLLAGEKPARLIASEPLRPEALAALLLPLPRETADRLSLAGWIPSERYTLEELGATWDVVVLPKDTVDSRWLEKSADDRIVDQAQHMAVALLENNPKFLPKEKKEAFSDDVTGPDHRSDPVGGPIAEQDSQRESSGTGRLAGRNDNRNQITDGDKTEASDFTTDDNVLEQNAPIPITEAEGLPDERQILNNSPSIELDINVSEVTSKEATEQISITSLVPSSNQPEPAFVLPTLEHSNIVYTTLYNFARLINRRSLRKSEFEAISESFGYYRDNPDKAEELAQQLGVWIKIVQTRPKQADPDQWEWKIEQLRKIKSTLQSLVETKEAPINERLQPYKRKKPVP